MAEWKVKVPSTVCATGNRPLLTHGWLIEEMRMHYSRPENINNPLLRDYVWKPEPDPDNGILVESVGRWTPQISGQRPAIVIRFNEIKPLKVAINNQEGYSDQGQKRFVKIMTASQTVFCIHKEYDATLLLMTEVYSHLLQFSDPIRSIFDLLMFELVHAGGPGELKEASDRYASPVTLAYAWSESWEVIDWAPLLKTMKFSYLFPRLGS
jgi:hypothetical protein